MIQRLGRSSLVPRATLFVLQNSRLSADMRRGAHHHAQLRMAFGGVQDFFRNAAERMHYVPLLFGDAERRPNGRRSDAQRLPEMEPTGCCEATRPP